MFQNSSSNLINGGTFSQHNLHESHFHSAKPRVIDLLLQASAPSAFHDSGERGPGPKWPADTHIGILADIMDWVVSEVDRKGKIMWLYGPAAAGKSLIAQTIAEQCSEQKRLLGSFFFSRGDPNRNHSGPLVATLAYQIALNLPPSRTLIEDAIDGDPAIFKRSLKAQFTSFIIEPLRQLSSSGVLARSSLNLIIIDGLDECLDQKVQDYILDIISLALKEHSLPIRFLISSRPERNLSLNFATSVLNAITRHLVLNDTYRASADVERYLEDSSNGLFKSFIPSSERDLGGKVKPRLPFSGRRRKLVLAFDVGTTYSGISYSILEPGIVPEVRAVTKFPGQEHASAAAKIPTIMYYDQVGRVQVVGAEAMLEGTYEMAEERRWIKAEWFKLHLKSRSGPKSDLPPLPPSKTVVEILADFLKYLFRCASSYIQDTHPNGEELWRSVVNEIDFVLSLPNGWEGVEQSQMRKAAVIAGLIPDGGSNCVTFVSEGAASLHYSIHNGLPDVALKRGEGFTVIDAGGGTIDISSYASSENIQGMPVTFEETTAPQSHFHGSVFVSIQARLFLDGSLSNSPFLDDLDHIVRCFDQTTKLRFRKSDELQYVKFGSLRDNDSSCGIRFGQLKLSGSDVASFFRPSVDCIVKAVLEQRRTSSKPVSHVILVGGFAESDWLYAQVQAGLTPYGLTVFRPESRRSKAVSDGAIAMYLNRFVCARLSKMAYGSFASIPYDRADSEHLQRVAKSSLSPAGHSCLSGRFDMILPKNTEVWETREFRRTYSMDAKSKSAFKHFSDSVWCYRGTVPDPKWRDVDPENYTKVCTIEVDLSHLSVTPRGNRETGIAWYRLEFDIILLVGPTQLKGVVAWMEKGIEKRSGAEIVYNLEDY